MRELDDIDAGLEITAAILRDMVRHINVRITIERNKTERILAASETDLLREIDGAIFRKTGA